MSTEQFPLLEVGDVLYTNEGYGWRKAQYEQMIKIMEA